MLEGSAEVRRTTEIEEPTNRFIIHPVSRALVSVFARWGVSPNAVSLAGFGLGAGAALAYSQYAQWPMALLGFVLMIAWHVMDGADGQLARLTGQTSELGRVLDGLCDHGTFVLVYISLAHASSQVLGAWVWAAAVLAGLSHLAQASAYEFQRGSYDWWVRGKASARPPSPEVVRSRSRGKAGVAAAFAKLHLVYLHLQRQMTRGQEPLQACLDEALQHDGAEADVRAAYHRINLPAVRRWNLLSSNYRTIAIFGACLAGQPALFFAFEIVVMNSVYLGLLAMQHKRDRALIDWLLERTGVRT